MRPPRWVLDTNIVVAGLLWHGLPLQVLNEAIDGNVTLYSSAILLDELAHTLGYPKFTARIAGADTSPDILVARYAAMVQRIEPLTIPRVIERDPDDDHVLACALEARADLIVSGDRDLLDLEQFQGIPIVTPRNALARIEAAR